MMLNSKFLKVMLVLLITTNSFFSQVVIAVPFEKEVEARQSFMEVLKFYMSILGEMGKEIRPYDSGLAETVATNLHFAAIMDNSVMWPAGSDFGNRKVHPITDAKTELWTDDELFVKKYKEFQSATVVLKQRAPKGIDQLKQGFTAVAKACTSCHESFRVEL